MYLKLLRGLRNLVWLPLLAGVLGAQEGSGATTTLDPATANAAAAAMATGAVAPARQADLIEHLVDFSLEAFGIKNESGANTWQHYAIAVFIFAAGYVFRKGFTRLVFGGLKRLSARTETTLDDELFAALQRPVAAFIAVFGAVLSVKVLKLSVEADLARVYLQKVAFSVVVIWLLISALNTVLDHLQAVAKQKQMNVAAFMPWIKKTVISLIVIFGALMAAQQLGADVKAFLAGLGIGGLAFALAAQDTLANVFGSVVVAVDQPFRVGDYVKIGGFEGTVEDIGLRSTKLRTPQRTLIIIPNKTVAAEAVNNFSRMPQRRVDQTIGLTYDSTPEKIEAVLADIRGLLIGNPDIAQDFIEVNFLNYGAFSLDIQIIYFTADPDVRESFALREKINFAIMRSVQAHGCSFAFPTQTIELGGEVAKRLGGLGTGAGVPSQIKG
jgi:MscS family membrane protein